MILLSISLPILYSCKDAQSVFVATESFYLGGNDG